MHVDGRFSGSFWIWQQFTFWSKSRHHGWRVGYITRCYPSCSILLRPAGFNFSFPTHSNLASFQLFFSAFLVRFRRKAAQFVWVVPALILVYEFVTFPESVFQSRFAAAFHQYFDRDFVIPEFRSWQGFATLISSNHDMTRGMAQLRFTAPCYAGVAYSLAAWLSRRTTPFQKAVKLNGQTEGA